MGNFAFALWLVFMPIIQSLLDLIGLLNLLTGINLLILQIEIWGICFTVFKIITFFTGSDKKQFFISFKSKIKNPIFYLVSGLIISIVISSFINGIYEYTFAYYSCFLIFNCIYNLEKYQTKIFTKLLLIIIAMSCVMGFIDPTNSFMPGFYENCFPLSLHFWNPNYSSYIVSICIIIVVFAIKSANKIQNYVFYILLFCIYALYLFMNGSFVAITLVFLTIILLIVFFWIKDKKFPIKFLMLLLAFIPFGFIVDLIPNINHYRTCDYNYFIECLAVVDNILGTKFLSLSGIESVAGADGWNRSEYLMLAFSKLNPAEGNLIHLLFGYGAGYFSQIRPHNSYIGLCLDYGIFTSLFYIAILIYFFIKYFKCKNKSDTIAPAVIIFMVSIIEFFGCLLIYWVWLYICILAFGFKAMKND